MNRTATGFDWTLMRSFLGVIEHGSLLAASRQLGASQPTIGRHVAELEQQLGVALFERTGRALVPTGAAMTIADDARAMAASADAIARRVSGQSRRTAGTVRITAIQMIACQVLPPLLAQLRAREPGLAIDVVASNTLSNLLRREADIALRMVRPDQASLVTRRIAHVEYALFAQRDYLRRRGLPRTAADLAAHDLVGFDSDERIVQGFRALGHEVARERFVLRTDDHLVYWEALRAGLGIGFAMRHVGDADPLLAPVLGHLRPLRLPIWLTVHREIRTSARIRAVYGFLAQAVPEALGNR
jgi:DNA-binding transcriptional LysR family regulator